MEFLQLFQSFYSHNKVLHKLTYINIYYVDKNARILSAASVASYMPEKNLRSFDNSYKPCSDKLENSRFSKEHHEPS